MQRSSRQTAVQQQQPTYEKTIQFQLPQAIVWQIKFILNQITSKKTMTSAVNEFENLSKQFGKEFDKYLLREIIDQIDLKDSVKAQRDKNEPFKSQLLSQELARCSQKPEFLLYFSEVYRDFHDKNYVQIAHQSMGDRLADFLIELTKRLRLNFPSQLLIALSISESAREDHQTEGLKILKQKLIDYHNYGKPEPLPEYAAHRLLFLLSTHPDLNHDESLKEIAQYIRESNPIKQTSHVALRIANPDLMYSNVSLDEPSISLFRDCNGLDNLDKSYRMLEPWQVLLDLGHYSSYNYNYLLKSLEDFKDINEKTMAKTLLQLSFNHSGSDDLNSKIVQATYEACKKGETSGLSKEPSDKKSIMGWSIDNLGRVFRELYSTLNWTKVFEALTEIEDDIILDQKAFSTFLQLFNKAKPQNLQYPLSSVLASEWQNPALQLNFIENSISFYIEKKERSINFQKTERRYEALEEIPGIKEKHPAELLNVWTCIDLVERLIILSDSHCYMQVRTLFDNPLKQIPEYLLLSVSMAKPNKGNILLDELLSFLMPQFLGNHINSLPVLQALWKSNQALMIRGICELCRHDQRVMNLSRVLDITQEVKESLLPIVNCDDYSFAVNLGILAGKRDFLHFDVWLKGRIKDIGTPFIKALLRYLKEQIIIPVNEYILRKQGNEDALETHKQQVLERSHLSKEKLCLTIEHLSDLRNSQNPKIKLQTHNQINEVVGKLLEQYPNQVQTLQNSEEIDNAANDYFQKVFSAEPQLVDQKIEELIQTMQKFKESDIKKEQEIYACMLHSLFDEYRFLHRYPQQYLEKIAKLFGAIIKHRIIDGTLQDIALKFAFEAFRREGKRQKFGVITIRQFFDMLPQFPQVFEDIYEIRNNIMQTDPQMIKDIEDLYERTMRNRQNQPHEEEKKNESASSKKQDEEKRESAKSSRNQANDLTSNSDANSSAGAAHSIAQIDSNKFLQTFQQNASGGRSNQQPPTQQNQQNNQANQAAPSQRFQNQQQRNLQTQPSDTSIGKTLSAQTTATAQPFVPSYKKKEQQQEQPKEPQQPSQQVPFQTPTPTEPSSLNIQSEIFRRTPSNNPNAVLQQPGTQNVPPVGRTPNPQIPQGPPILPSPQMMNQPQLNQMILPNFRPVNNRSPIPTLQQSPQVTQMQQLLDAKIQRAITENFKVRLEDLIEDSNLPGPPPEAQEQIKFICNNTGKNNFGTKVEELKLLINNQNAQPNLNWFIQYILTKRISQQTANLHQIYIDMIKQLNTKESISLTLAQSVELFKRCMLIDEEQFQKISQRGNQQGSPVKQYLINLGTFLGLMTVAQNRPILARELDIKQLLVEAYASEKLKLVVIFVCRIFKECQKSNIFKANNPWIKAILEILKEINEWAFQNNHQNQNQDILMEIEALCRHIGLQGINDVAHNGFLKASQTRQFQSSSQQVEINHLFNKTSLIPAPPAAQPQIQQPQPVNPLQNQAVSNENFRFERQQNPMINRAQSISPIPNIGSGFGPVQINNSQMPFRLQTPTNDQPLLQQNQQSFMPNQLQQQQQQQPIQKLTTQEIYPRVVVSQETLQLFSWLGPQKEQLLRQVVGDAVDSSIVEILPPVVDRSVTIALITTRELVLKDFAYDGDYVKIQNAADMIVQNLAGSLALVTCREPLKMSLTTNLRKFLNQMLTSYRGQGGNDSSEPPLTEAQINEVASTASKENLELGCKLIKKSVISKALAKVREDQQMMRAIDQRKQTQGQNSGFFVDQSLIAQFADLPPQLQPNQNGLTDAQFQVYEDFQRLNQSTKKIEPPVLEGPTGQVQIQQEPLSNDLGSLLQIVEKRTQLDEVLKFQLTQKLCGSEQQPASLTQEEQQKLWNFCNRSLQAVCESLSTNDLESIGGVLETLSFIIQNYKLEDLSKRLTQIFLSFSVDIVNNCNLTIKLMKEGIISTSEWDSQIGFQLRDSQQFQIEEKFMSYIINFFIQGVKEEKSFSYNQFPNAVQAIEKMSEKNPQVERYCKDILEDLRQGSLQSKETLRNYINEWAVLSFEENNPNQEAEINKYFYKLMGLYRDPEVMYNFCKVMVEVSIERALYTADGQKRPTDRLDYRYIESFLKLMAVLLRTNDINKHEFMAKLFEAIHEVLEEDHKSKKTDFNQKPYIRLLINILIAVNNSNTQSQLFNPKTHLLILFGLADLFSKLNPNKYPAFSFAWLELISHNQFMPLFLAIQGNSQYNNFVGNLQYQSQTPSQAPNRRGGPSAPNQAQAPNTLIQDNTFYQKWFKFKELIVNLFTFLKNNMIPGQKMPTGLHKFYEATLRVVLVIRHDFPEFLSDFYFNFVNSLPEHCIQLRNIILSAQPRVIKYYNPFSRHLKVDTLPEINQKPKTMISYDTQHQFDMPDMNFGDYQVYLNLNNLREDLEKYFRTKQPQLINVICEKMMMSEEVINGRRRINSNIINAVALFIGNNALQKNTQFQQKDCYDMLKKIILNLNAETKWCLLNSLINELRYINNFTYFYSWIVIYLFSDNDESVQEQITRILIERLQVSEPHPWGLCITFRELLQNPKYQFAKKSFVVQNLQTIEYLLQTKLQAFYVFWNQQRQSQNQQQQPHHQQQE